MRANGKEFQVIESDEREGRKKVAKRRFNVGEIFLRSDGKFGNLISARGAGRIVPAVLVTCLGFGGA